MDYTRRPVFCRGGLVEGDRVDPYQIQRPVALFCSGGYVGEAEDEKGGDPSLTLYTCGIIVNITKTYMNYP